MQALSTDVSEERTLSSERLYEGRTVSLRIDSVASDRDPSTTRRREVIEHPGAAVIIPQRDPDSLVLVRQWRHAAGRRMWEVPAGALDPNETLQACAARELQEETGFTAGRLTPLFSGYSAPGFSAEVLHFFHATELIPGESRPDEGEELLVRDFSLEELRAALQAGELFDVKTQLAVLWACAQKRPKL
jgi:ADP-ribose pyrophosphatase